MGVVAVGVLTAVVLAVVVIGSASNALFGTAEHSSLRNLVASGQLPAAVARNEARTYATSLAGPPLGGLLFGLGRAIPFLGDEVTFLASYTKCSKGRLLYNARKCSLVISMFFRTPSRMATLGTTTINLLHP